MLANCQDVSPIDYGLDARLTEPCDRDHNEAPAYAMQIATCLSARLIVQRELMESPGTAKSGSKSRYLLEEVFNEFSGCSNPGFTPKHPARY
jgi:hypothetical protein